MDDLISRTSVLEYLDKRRTYELMDGRNKAYGKGVRDAMKDIESQPSIPAVPLDKLCECLVRKRIGFVDEVDGKRLTATLDKALWAALIKEWMEGLDGSESMVQKT